MQYNSLVFASWCSVPATSYGIYNAYRACRWGLLTYPCRVPISTSFGRRPVYLFSVAICLGSCVWQACAHSYGSFMGACVLNGIGAGPAETVQPAVIADIFFLHARGKWNTLY